jgi:transketolase
MCYPFYQLEVFPDGVPVMSIEAGGIHGWRKYAHAPFGMETFGVSAPAPAIYNLFGFTVPNLVTRAREVIEYYQATGAPSLLKYPKFPALGPSH